MPGASCTCGSPHPPLPMGELHLEVEALFLVHGSRALSAMALSQKEAIAKATADSLAKAGAYTDEVLAGCLKALDRAAKDVKAQILALGDLSQFGPGSQPGKAVQLARLKAMEKNLATTAAGLKKDLTLAYQGVTGDMAKAGIEGKLAQLGAMKVGGYQALDQAGREALAEAAFSLVPTDALDFLSTYQLQLLGKLSDDLVAGIKSAVQVGIAQGEGPAKIARRIGGIVKDPDEFRQAGKTVFKTVQQRAELIARSEVMRAYNQGAVKFETQVGIRRGRWLTAGDERTCADCGPLDGKEYNLVDMPSQPLHPACRCTHVPADISQLLSKEALESQLAGKTLEDAAVKDALKGGDYSKLTVVQLREVAKEKGVSIARTKADRISILSKASGQSEEWLAGHTMNELEVWFKQYKIGALKSKDELLQAINQVDHATKAAQLAALKQAEAAALKAKKQAELAALRAQKAQELAATYQAKVAQVMELGPKDYQAFHAQMSQLDVLYKKHKAVAGVEGSQGLVGQFAQALDGFRLKVEKTSQAILRDILKADKVKHFQWYSKSDAALYMTDPSARAILIEKTAAKAAAAKDAAKLKKAPALKPPAAAPASKVAPVASPAVQARSADEAWEAYKAKNPFTFHGDAKALGGVHTKYFYLDDVGEKWLFKPINEDFRAWGDEVAYLVQREIDPDVIEVRYIELKDLHGRQRMGSIQKMKKGLRDPSNFEKMDVAAIDPAELVQVQREHVVDWLISNHDGHAGQFLRAQDGRVYGIDKGQLYKYFGRDKLSVDYAPNAGGGFDEPLYNKLLRAHRDGKIKLDLQATEERIRRVEAISDAAFREMLMPYAGRRFAGQPGALEDFLRAALERKNAIRADFERLYSQIESARTGKKVAFRFGAAADETVPVAAADDGLAWARGSRIDLKKEVEAIRESGWQGRSLAVDKGDIEDQNVLVREVMLSGGKRRTVLQFKLRPEADRQLVRDLVARATGAAEGLPPPDPYWGHVLAAAKTLNFHAVDHAFSASKVSAALDHRKSLQALFKSGNVLERAMAKHYLGVLDEIERVRDLQLAKQTAQMEIVQAYKPSATDLAASQTQVSGKGMTVRWRDKWTEDRVVSKGRALVVEEEAVNLSAFDYRLRDGLREYEIDFGDGVKAVYKPFQPNAVKEDLAAFALQGRMEVKVDGGVSEAVISKAMERLQQLGINAAPSTALDEELMYLQKVAYVRGVDRSPAFLQASKRSIDATPDEAIRIWREVWSQHLGVSDVTKLPDYDPVGSHQYAPAVGKMASAGTRIHKRFDLALDTIRKEMSDYVLTHDITSGTLEEFFSVVLPRNQSFIPTAERFGTGVPIGGMSPGRDLDTGGASYFFTRLAHRSYLRKEQILLKTDMLSRTDAITYSQDWYGNVIGDTVRNMRRSDPDRWKYCATQYGNETLFKGAVPILDNLEGVKVGSEAQRKRIVKLFKDNGIYQLPDGRKIEDVVVSKASQLKRSM